MFALWEWDLETIRIHMTGVTRKGPSVVSYFPNGRLLISVKYQFIQVYTVKKTEIPEGLTCVTPAKYTLSHNTK